MDKKIGLVLSGGGARGAYQIGVWKALILLGIKPDIITATSVGTLNAAMIIQGDWQRAHQLWSDISTNEVFDVDIDDSKPLSQKVSTAIGKFLVDFLLQGGTDNYPLKLLMKQYIDEDIIRASNIDLGIVTIKMDEKIIPCQLLKEDIPKGRLHDFMLASSAIFPAIRAYEIDGIKYIDGAYHDNLPVEMAINKGAEFIIAVDLEAFGVVRKSFLESLNNIVYIKSYWNLGATLVFDKQLIARNIRLGFLDTMKAFKKYEGVAYTFNLGSIEQYKENFGNKFLESLKNLGFSTDINNPTRREKVQYAKMLKNVGRKQSSNISMDEIQQICMECAGEIFNVDCEKTYTIRNFRIAMLHEIKKVILPEDITFAEKGIKTGVLSKGGSILTNMQERTLFFAKKIVETIASDKIATGFLPLTIASLSTKEFAAALYIVSISGTFV